MNESYPTLPPEPIAVEEIASGQPQHIGRYRVARVLGEGGFGLVYLAHDDQLQRPVAVKVPHRALVSRSEDAKAYLNEGSTVAKLDHPNIVPVYDVGNNKEYPVFVVSQYLEGNTLAQRIKENRPSLAEATELVATVAETLHYAHKQGIVHRDIKPGNILLDTNGKPFVADFGLALRETDVGKGPSRQWHDTIPKELELICLRALSKRASDRYTTGKDMADDLRHWLRPLHEGRQPGEGEPGPAEQVLEPEPGLSKHVFISYATADQETAFRLCRLLEEQGIGCWIAPRDGAPGDDYGVAIIQAIEGTAATLLMLSAHSNASIHVTHEVERATSKRKRVIPVRLEDVKPSPSLERSEKMSLWKQEPQTD